MRRAMVPEVLLALLGVPGEVITLVPATSDGGQERFRVSPDLPFLEPPERASLDRLVSLGYAFRCLERFVAREDEAGTTMATLPSDPKRRSRSTRPAGWQPLPGRSPRASPTCSPRTSPPSAWSRTFVRGHPALPAARTAPGFALVLPALHVTLRPVIERPDLKGAPLLHHLHAAALAAGAPQLEAALRSLRARCYRAVYQQLLAWTVHGVLVDPHGEFWVRPVEGAGGDGGVYLGDFDESGAAKGTGADGDALGGSRINTGSATGPATAAGLTLATTPRSDAATGDRRATTPRATTAASASGTGASRYRSRLCRRGWSCPRRRLCSSRVAR